MKKRMVFTRNTFILEPSQVGWAKCRESFVPILNDGISPTLPGNAIKLSN
jgi:hypothetical protein